MPKQSYPGVSHYKDRHGKLRWRYRDKHGKTFNLGTVYGSDEFERRYKAAVQGVRLTSDGSGEAVQRSSQAPQHSLSTVIDSWYGSVAFKKLGDSTAKNYTSLAENLRREYGEFDIRELDVPTIKKIMAKKADTPASANNALRILRFLLDHAKDDLQIVTTNDARDVKKLEVVGDGFHTWSEEEIDLFRKKYPEGTPADMCMTLMLYTGAARGDAVQLGPKNRKDGRIRYSRKKMKSRGGAEVNIPEHPELTRRLDALPEGHETFLQTEQGKARTAAGLGAAMRKWCDAVQDAEGNKLLAECSSHGLRKAIARRLAEAGATPHEIMSVTGHKTLSEVERYTAKAGRSALADKGMERLK